MVLLDLWLKALMSDLGLAITTDNRALLRQHLYRARLESNDPRLESLAMILPEQPDEIWLVRKDASGLGTNHQGYPQLIHS